MNEQYVIVESVAGRLEAEILRGLLESQGLDAALSQEAAASIYGFGVGRLARADILVPEDQVEHAKKVLNAYYAGDLETDDASESSPA